MTEKGNGTVREPDFVISRVFDAPREQVFKGWTHPAHVKNWWGPKDFTAPYCKIDFQPGGSFHFCMRSPDGKEYWNTGSYRAIVVPEKIVSTMYFSDSEGNILKPRDYGFADDFPIETIDVVTFNVLGRNKTNLTLRRNHSQSVAMRYGERQGWNESLDRFAKELAESI
jgi:uncharacterized protein YndB with AHSA1/START domain